MRGAFMALSLLAVAATYLPAPARAAVNEETFRVRTAGDLATLCAGDDSEQMRPAAAGFCEGFMVGVYQTLEQWQAAHGAKLFCIPAHPPTRAEAIQQFVGWVQSTPAEQNERPADAVLRFLMQKFPCK